MILHRGTNPLDGGTNGIFYQHFRKTPYNREKWVHNVSMWRGSLSDATPNQPPNKRDGILGGYSH